MRHRPQARVRGRWMIRLVGTGTIGDRWGPMVPGSGWATTSRRCCQQHPLFRSFFLGLHSPTRGVRGGLASECMRSGTSRPYYAPTRSGQVPPAALRPWVPLKAVPGAPGCSSVPATPTRGPGMYTEGGGGVGGSRGRTPELAATCGSRGGGAEAESCRGNSG